jgi:hypothetical protein
MGVKMKVLTIILNTLFIFFFGFNAHAKIIYSNDFNDDPTGPYTISNLNADWNNPPWAEGVSEGRVEIIDGPEALEGKSLKCRYPAYTLDRNQWQLFFDRGYEELYSSFWIKFADDFDFVITGKVPGFAGGRANAGGNKPNGRDGFGGILNWSKSGEVLQYVYHPDPHPYDPWGEGFLWNIGGQRYFQPGKWHYIENYVRMNTPGKHDGIIRGWFDGKLAFEKTSFRFRDIDSFAVDLFFFQTHFGGGGTQYQPKKDEFIYFDKFIIATERITSPQSLPKQASNGSTTIARWKNNKNGAFTMNFDDSMISQADIAVPAFIERGLVGTWYINPGTTRYKLRQEVWEVTCPEKGQDLGVHSMTHKGASSYEQADWEIGENVRIIWSLRPPNVSKLLSFCWPGATTWEISDKQKKELMTKYHLIHRRSMISARTDLGVDGDVMIKSAQKAISQRTWVSIHFHGIGDEYLSVEEDDFIQLLDYLVTVKDKLWIAGYINVHKYIEERDSAEVKLLEADSNQIRLRLTSQKNPALYDEPLTLITTVPSHWEDCLVVQDGNSAIFKVFSGSVMYNAIPGKGEIVLSSQANLHTTSSSTEMQKDYVANEGGTFELIIDNDFPAFTANRFWNSSKRVPGYYGNDYLWTYGGGGEAIVEWVFQLPSEGNYLVSAWWSAPYQTRASDAPYTIFHADGSTTVDVDQRANGSQWNKLGTYYFLPGETRVILTNDTSGNPVADALKITYIHD